MFQEQLPDRLEQVPRKVWTTT